MIKTKNYEFQANFDQSNIFFLAYLKESEDKNVIVAQITATDADNGVNGDVITVITTRTLQYPSQLGDDAVKGDVTPLVGPPVSGFFQMNEGGFVSTMRTLDRESIPGFVIDVQSCDGGTPSR